MLTDGLLFAQSSEFLQRIDSDFLGVICLVGCILFFVTLIISMVTITRTRENLLMARMHKEMIEDLLAKGYSAEDVERLVYGDSRWNKIRRALGGRIPKRWRQQFAGETHPVPPVKNHAHSA